MRTAALFDLDGVLVNTEYQYTNFWKRIGLYDFPQIEDFALCIKGHTLFQIFEEYYKNNLDRQVEIAKQLDIFESEMDFPFIKGVVSFLSKLRDAHIYTAVVTSSNNKKMENLYRCHPDFINYFDHIFTAEDTARSKPAPDCYLTAAKFFNLSATDCFVFEDSINGLQAGYDSGATVIGLTTTNNEKEIRLFCKHTMKDFTKFTIEQMLHLK